MDAPKRTPLSEEMRAAGTQTTYPDSAKGHLLYFAGRVAALEQERDARYEDLLERFEGYGLDRENLRQDNLRLRAAIAQALTELRDDGGDPFAASEATARMLFRALTKPEGE